VTCTLGNIVPWLILFYFVEHQALFDEKKPIVVQLECAGDEVSMRYGRLGPGEASADGSKPILELVVLGRCGGDLVRAQECYGTSFDASINAVHLAKTHGALMWAWKNRTYVRFRHISVPERFILGTLEARVI